MKIVKENAKKDERRNKNLKKTERSEKKEKYETFMHIFKHNECRTSQNRYITYLRIKNKDKTV